MNPLNREERNARKRLRIAAKRAAEGDVERAARNAQNRQRQQHRRALVRARRDEPERVQEVALQLVPDERQHPEVRIFEWQDRIFEPPPEPRVERNPEEVEFDLEFQRLFYPDQVLVRALVPEALAEFWQWVTHQGRAVREEAVRRFNMWRAQVEWALINERPLVLGIWA